MFCPMKFKKIWIDGVEKEGSGSYKMDLGTRFHDFAKDFFMLAPVIAMNRWDTLIPEEFVWEEYQWAKWFVDLERRRKRRLEAEGRADEWVPLATELHIRSDFLKFEGTVDRVDWWDKARNQIAIIEYKTGKWWDNASLKRQIAMYAVLVGAEIFVDKDIAAGVVINPRLKRVEIFEINENLLKLLARSIVKLKLALETEDFVRKCSPIKYALCGLCDLEEVEF